MSGPPQEERPYTLGEILEAHRVETLGPLGPVKCHACDDWTAGTIHDHHADLALAFFNVPALTARLAAVEAVIEATEWDDWPGRFRLIPRLRAALTPEATP